MAKPCELRLTRPIPPEEGGGTEIVCGAADVRLAVEGGNQSRLEAICGACEIPQALATNLACLHLRPVRTIEPHGPRSHYACRWFYRLNPKRQPRTIQAGCGGCPYWFPRPSIEMLAAQGYWRETEIIRTAITAPAAETLAPNGAGASWRPPPKRTEDRPAWQRALRKLVVG
jgi:hypothetical protein